MKRFRFRLQSLLEIRKAREEKALAQLGAAQRGLAQALQIKSERMSALDQALLKREALSEKTTIANDHALAHQYILGLKQQIVQQNAAISRAHKEVERALRNYLAAKRSTLAIDKLRERDLAEFKKLISKQEQREQDDFSVMRGRLREESA